MSDWSELPDDLIARIISLLPVQDYVRFGAVCRSWCSITKQKNQRPTSQVPWLLLSDSAETNTRTVHSPYEKKLYNMNLPHIYGRHCCGSSHGWLATVDYDLVVHLCHPFSGARIQLPSLPAWALNPSNYSPTCRPRRIWCIHKLILSADPSYSEDYVVMALIRGSRDLAFWRPGKFGWFDIQTSRQRKSDAIWYDDKFYAINNSNVIIVVDPCSVPIVKTISLTFSSQVPAAVLEQLYACRRYLVELMGQLLIVFKKYEVLPDYKVSKRSRAVCFKVFKVDLIGRRMELLDSIGEYAVFVGTNHSVSISACKFEGCRKNCIYFTGNEDWPVVIGDAGIYNLSDGTVERFSPNDVFSPAASISVWFDPNLW